MQSQRRTTTIETAPQGDLAAGALMLWDGVTGFLRRRKSTIISTALIVLALGLVITFLMPSYYRSTTTIALLPQPVRQGQQPPYTPEQRLQIEMQAVQARDVLSRVVDKQGLARLPEFNPALRQDGLFSVIVKIASSFFRRNGNFVPTPEELKQLERSRIVDIVAARVTVIPVRTADILQVTFASRDPRLSYRVANEIADSYVGQSLSRQADTLQAVADALQARIESVKRELRELPAAGAASESMEKQLEARRTLLQTYIGKLGEVLLQKAALEPPAFVQARAVLPLEKSGIPLYQAIPVLLLAGLILGVGLGIVREGMQRTVVSAPQLQSVWGLRAIGSSASAEGGAPPPRRANGRADMDRACQDVTLELLLKRQSQARLVAAFAPVNANDGADKLCLDVGRALANSGHTTVVVNVARSSADLAAHGPEPALRPRKLGNTKVVDETVSQAQVRMLDVFDAGIEEESPAVAYRRAGEAIADLAEKYEFVLVNLASVDSRPGAKFIASFVDLIIVVLRAGAQRSAVTASLEQLAAAGPPLMGAVLLPARESRRSTIRIAFPFRTRRSPSKSETATVDQG